MAEQLAAAAYSLTNYLLKVALPYDDTMDKGAMHRWATTCKVKGATATKMSSFIRAIADKLPGPFDIKPQKATQFRVLTEEVEDLEYLLVHRVDIAEGAGIPPARVTMSKPRSTCLIHYPNYRVQFDDRVTWRCGKCGEFTREHG